MHDPAYKRLFSQPRMVQDLMRGFVAPDWSDALDFSTLKLEPLPRLEEVRTMLAEQVREWTAEWVAEGREQGLKEGIEQGIERGRSEERRLLCRQAARKFDTETAPRLAALLDRLSDPERLAQVGDWIIECGTEAELLARVQDALL